MVRPATPLKPLAWYKKLATKKGRLAAGAFLVEGDRAITQMMRYDSDAILEILATEAYEAAYGQYPLRLLTAGQLRAICHSQTPQGILALMRLPLEVYTHTLPPSCGPKILLLEDVQDPGNVGTLIRTAAAFGFSGMILTEKCADPFAPKTVQATAGSILSLWLRRTPQYLSLAETLKYRGYTFVVADVQGEDEPAVLGQRERLLLALGNEAAGLSPALRHAAQARVAIPVERTEAESLNVASCGAICMYLSVQPK